jgi:hypothetical protein
MISTCSDYKRSGQELLSRLEQSRPPRMEREYHGENEEEYPKVRLDQLE